MKTLRCRDAGFDCDAEIHASTEDEVMAQVTEHAQQVHNVNVTPELDAQIRTLIKEEASETESV